MGELIKPNKFRTRWGEGEPTPKEVAFALENLGLFKDSKGGNMKVNVGEMIKFDNGLGLTRFVDRSLCLKYHVRKNGEAMLSELGERVVLTLETENPQNVEFIKFDKNRDNPQM